MRSGESVDWASVAAELVEDDGEAVREHLAAGRTVSYRDDNTPAGHVVRRHADGRRELVRIDRLGEVVVALLAPR